MKGFINLLTLVVAVTAEAINTPTISSTTNKNTKDEPIRRLGVAEGFEKDNDVSELDMKLLQIITEMIYPDGKVNENEIHKTRYRVIAESDSGTETYLIGAEKYNQDRKSARIVRIEEGGKSGPSGRSLFRNNQNQPIRTFRIVNTLAHASDGYSGSDDINEIHTGSNEPGSLGAAANNDEGLSYARPENTKTVKIEGGIVLRIADNRRGRARNLAGASSRDEFRSNSHGRERENGPPEEIRIIRVRGPPPGNRNGPSNNRPPRPPFQRNRPLPPRNRPPPRGPPNGGGRRPQSEPIRIIHEDGPSGLAGNGRNINPDIQAFQIINDINNNGYDSEGRSRKYRIRVIDSSGE